MYLSMCLEGYSASSAEQLCSIIHVNDRHLDTSTEGSLVTLEVCGSTLISKGDFDLCQQKIGEC